MKERQIDNSLLFVINDAFSGNERPYNAMRHTMNLSKREGVQFNVFLVTNEVNCARKGQCAHEG